MNSGFCMGCMRRTAGEDEKICPVCGWQHGSSTGPSFALPPGSSLHDGRYLVGRVLGNGGFGITYIGMDRLLNLRVAVKEYFPAKLASREAGTTSLRWTGSESDRRKGRESFVREARNMARINAIPGIVRVRDIFYQNQTAYIVMDYIDGVTLRESMEKNGLPDEEECRRIFFPLMRSLSEAHQAGLIHRDISPDNIMLEGDGASRRVWLLDMGAAKEAELRGPEDSGSPGTTSLIVRHGFSPPEQYSDAGPIGPWTDIYALAATVYYCLTGHVVPDAFSRLGDDALAFPETVSAPLRAVLQKALAVRPEARYASVDDLLQEWEAAAAVSPKAGSKGGAGSTAGASGNDGTGQSAAAGAVQNGKPLSGAVQNGKPSSGAGQSDGGPEQSGTLPPGPMGGAETGVGRRKKTGTGSGAGTGTSGRPAARKKSSNRILLAAAAALMVFGIILLAVSLQKKTGSAPETLTVEMLGSGNANMANGGLCSAVGEEYAYYISGDSVLWECEKDADTGTFYLMDAKKADDRVTFLSTDGECVYYIGERELGKKTVSRLRPGGKPEDLEVYQTEGTVRDLQYVRLSDGREYLYYMVGGGDPASLTDFVLHRRSLAEADPADEADPLAETDASDEAETASGGKDAADGAETASDGKDTADDAEAGDGAEDRSAGGEIPDTTVCWYNLYGEYIYYTCAEGKDSFVLYRRKIDGGEPERLNDTKNLFAGFIEDDLLFAFSLRDETMLVFHPDGSPNEEFEGLYDQNVDNTCGLGYGEGWLYYTDRSDGGIHRIRTNGTGDELLVSGHRAALLCTERATLFFMERTQDRTGHFAQQLYASGKSTDSVFAVQDPYVYWNLPDISAEDLTYEVSEEDGSVTVTGCSSDAVSFRLPAEIDGKPVKRIGERAFKDSTVQTVGLPEGLVEIGEEAFCGCRSLTFAGLPDSLRVIGTYAFGDCVSLTDVFLPEGLERIGNYAFAESALASAQIPASVTEIGEGAFAVFAEAGLTAFTVDPGNGTFASDNGLLYRTGTDADGSRTFELLQCPSGIKGQVTVPDGVTSIGSFAFAHCTGLTAVEIPDSVQSVGYGAFLGCGITEISVSATCEVNSATGADIEIHYRS